MKQTFLFNFYDSNDEFAFSKKIEAESVGDAFRIADRILSKSKIPDGDWGILEFEEPKNKGTQRSPFGIGS